VFNTELWGHNKPIVHPTCRVIFKPELLPYDGSLFKKIKTWFKNYRKIAEATRPKCIRHVTLNSTFIAWSNYPCVLSKGNSKCYYHIPSSKYERFAYCCFVDSRYNYTEDTYLCLTEEEFNNLLHGEIIKVREMVWR